MTARFLLFLGFSLCTSFSSLSLSHSLLLVRFLLAWRVSRVCNVAKRNITTNHFECWVSDFFTVSLFGYALYLYCVCVCVSACILFSSGDRFHALFMYRIFTVDSCEKHSSFSIELWWVDGWVGVRNHRAKILSCKMFVTVYFVVDGDDIVGAKIHELMTKWIK